MLIIVKVQIVTSQMVQQNYRHYLVQSTIYQWNILTESVWAYLGAQVHANSVGMCRLTVANKL